MLEHLASFWDALKPNFNDFVIEGVIMISAIITILGILKKFLFNKIKNKAVRKFLLSITSLVFVFVGTGAKFIIKSTPFADYLLYAIAYSLGTIVIYWFYESFGIRLGLHEIGKLTLNKLWKLVCKIFKKIFAGEKVDVEKELLSGLDTIKQEVSKEIPTYIKHDNDIEKL